MLLKENRELGRVQWPDDSEWPVVCRRDPAANLSRGTGRLLLTTAAGHTLRN